MKIDGFDDGWFTISPGKIPLDAVKGVSIVPMSRGSVALLITTRNESRHEASTEVVGGADMPLNKTQVLMSPEYARWLANNLLAAANQLKPPN